MIKEKVINEDGEVLMLCHQCGEYDEESQIEDHGVCYDCMQANYEKAQQYCPLCGAWLDSDIHCFECGADLY